MVRFLCFAECARDRGVLGADLPGPCEEQQRQCECCQGLVKNNIGSVGVASLVKNNKGSVSVASLVKSNKGSVSVARAL